MSFKTFLVEQEAPQFRNIKREDTDRVLEIEAAFKDAPWKKANSFLKSGYDTQVMVVDDIIVGYFITKKGEHMATLVKMAIDPKLQGKGYGFIMMSKLKSKYSQLDLDVRANNASAISLYKKFGFKTIETRKSYYKNGDDAVYMKLGV